jgi:hypothetical protein
VNRKSLNFAPGAAREIAGRSKLGRSWISETLSMLAHDQTDIERWRWQESVNGEGWQLAIEGKYVCAKELFDSTSLSECLLDKDLQAELVVRLRKVVDLFSEVACPQKMGASKVRD